MWLTLVLVLQTTSAFTAAPQSDDVARLFSALWSAQWARGADFTALVVTPSMETRVVRVLNSEHWEQPVTRTAMLKARTYARLWPRKPQRLVVFVDTVQEFETFLYHVAEDENWNPQAEVVVVTRNESDVEPLLAATWDESILYPMRNTIVALLTENVPEFFTFIQSPSPNCDKTTLIRLNSTLFLDKFKDFGGCPLKVSNINVPPYFFTPGKTSVGVHAKMLDIVAKSLNFTYVLEPKTLSEKGLSDRRYLETITNVLNRKIDILPYPVSPIIGELCYTFTWGGVSIAVPRAEFVPIWMNLIVPFDSKVWFCSLVVLIIETILEFVFLPHSFWPSLASKIGTSTTQHDKIVQLSQRWFLCNMFLTGIVLNTAYHSALYQSLTVPKRYPDMNSLEDLLQTKLPVYGNRAFQDYIRKAPIKKYEMVAKRTIISQTETYQDLRNLVKFRNFTYGSDSLVLKYSQNYLYTTEKVDFHLIPRFAGGLNSFMVPFGSPHAKSFGTVIRKVVQSGLYYKWENDLAKKKTTYSKININKTLSIKHFTGAFFALFIGYTSSFVLFLFEIIQGKSKNWFSK